jgi:hypothetical protein
MQIQPVETGFRYQWIVNKMLSLNHMSLWPDNAVTLAPFRSIAYSL